MRQKFFLATHLYQLATFPERFSFFDSFFFAAQMRDVHFNWTASLEGGLLAAACCHNLGQENDKSLEQNARHQRGRHLSWLGNMFKHTGGTQAAVSIAAK